MRFKPKFFIIVFIFILALTSLDAQRRKRNWRKPGPKVGRKAPGFELLSLDTGKKISLASFRDKKDVVLIFGSYT